MRSRALRLLLAMALLIAAAVTGAAIGCTEHAAAAAYPGRAWTQVTGLSTAPSARLGAAMAYDTADAQTVLYGGATSNGASSATNETWTWNGSAWTSQSPATSPTNGRAYAAMAYDSATHQTVMFGGIGGASNSNTRLNDTWTWGGGTWTQAYTTAPSGLAIRQGASMAWDPGTGQLILFGGYGGSNGTTYFNDTWVWTGSTWSQLSPATSPPARTGAALAYDAAGGRLVLFGGSNGGALGDTWTWNGTTWAQSSAAAPADYGTAPSAAFDPTAGALTLMSGCTDAAVCPDTFTWTGSGWTQRPSLPSARAFAAMSFDPQSAALLVVDGWTGNTVSNTMYRYGVSPTTSYGWVQAASSGPAARSAAAMAFDTATGQLLLFGGANGSSQATLLGDTWAWNGTSWTNVTPSGTSPSPRRNAALGYDEATGQLLLFGGQDANGPEGDTWSWTWSAASGTGTWTNVTPASASASPSPRTQSALDYDAATGQMLLVGGANASGTIGETWSWSGTAWTNLNSDYRMERRSSGLALDQATGRFIAQGGQATYNGGNYNHDGTYQWLPGSTSWSSSPIANHLGSVMDFDPRLGALVLYDDTSGSTSTLGSSSWSALSVTASPPQYTASGGLTAGNTAGAYDPATGQFVLFGGWTAPATYGGATWVLGPTPGVVAASSISGSATLNGYDQTVGVAQTVEIDDPNTAGWNVTVQANQAPTGSSVTLPNLVLTSGAATAATGSGALSPTCVAGTCTAAGVGNAVGLPLTVPVGSAATLYSAAAGSGVGRIGLPLKLWTTIPANTPAGTYTSTVTVTVSSGP